MKICTENDQEHFILCHGQLTDYTYNVKPTALSTEHYWN